MRLLLTIISCLAIYTTVGMSFIFPRLSPIRFDEAEALLLLVGLSPLIYLILSPKPFTLKQQGLRFVALVFLGLLFLSWIVPEEQQSLLPGLMWLRTGGIAVIVVLEGVLFITILKMLFSDDASAEQVADKTGAPLPIAKLMALEARFWKALWSFASTKKLKK